MGHAVESKAMEVDLEMSIPENQTERCTHVDICVAVCTRTLFQALIQEVLSMADNAVQHLRFHNTSVGISIGQISFHVTMLKGAGVSTSPKFDEGPALTSALGSVENKVRVPN